MDRLENHLSLSLSLYAISTYIPRATESVLSSELGPPPPLQQASVSPPLLVPGGYTRLRDRGAQLGRLGKKPSTLSTLQYACMIIIILTRLLTKYPKKCTVVLVDPGPGKPRETTDRDFCSNHSYQLGSY